MVCGGRTDMTELVGRGRGDAAPSLLECPQQGLRNRMRRTTQADRVLAARNGCRYMPGTLKDQRQRPRPIGIYQLARIVGDLLRPVCDVGIARQMNNNRMIGRTALGSE